MLPDQRRKKLLEVLALSGAADVASLSNTLAVSPATVRRDLHYLEDQGFLRRTHGGAVLPFESTAFYPHHENKLEHHQSEKATIARAAARRVANGDVLVLDSGTTTLLLAKELKTKRDLTIVTPDLKIVLELIDVQGFEVIAVGGTVRPRSYNTFGAFAEQMLRELNANHVFLGADGIDLRAGVTNATVVEVSVKRHMMGCGRAVTLIADHSKFGRVGLAKVAELTDFAEIITGPGLSVEALKRYQAAGAMITVVQEES